MNDNSYLIVGDFGKIGGSGRNFFQYMELIERGIDPNEYFFRCKFTNEYCVSNNLTKYHYDIENKSFKYHKIYAKLPDPSSDVAIYLYFSNLESYIKIAKLCFIKELSGIKVHNKYLNDADFISNNLLSEFIKSMSLFNKKYNLHIMPFSMVGLRTFNTKNYSEENIFKIVKEKYNFYINLLKEDYNTYDEWFKDKYENTFKRFDKKIIDYNLFVENRILSNTRFDNHLDRVKEYDDLNNVLIEKWDNLFLNK